MLNNEYLRTNCRFVLHRDKVPVDITGQNIDHLNPDNQYTGDAIAPLVQATGSEYSIVLDGSGTFVIDVDKCRNKETGELNQVAQNLLASMPKAYWEISRSGTGIHIVGAGHISQEFMNKNKELGLEIYDCDRHICTGQYQGGEIYDWSAHLPNIQAQYWRPRTEVGAADWTDKPVEGYTGPTDPDELLRIWLEMPSATTPEAMFGGNAPVKASNHDLWTRNVTVLSQAFPDPDPQKEFGYSEADMSLATRLLWMTGGNCALTESLMRQSGLKRDKWDQHKNYLKGFTIIRAAAGVKEYYKGKPEMFIPPSLTEVGNAMAEGKTYYSPEEWSEKYPYGSVLTVEEQAELFEGCVYIKSQRKVFTPYNRMFRNPEEFRDDYSHWDFVHGHHGKSTDDPWKAFVKTKTTRYEPADVACFRPELFDKRDENGNRIVVFEEEGRKMFSTYVPIPPLDAEGDATPFLNHVAKLLPDERDQKILLSYMASAVQNPGHKFQWAPILQGSEGNGKTFLLTALSRIIGYTYSHVVNASELGNGGSKFNSWIENKLLVGVEELHTKDKRDVVEALKPLITNEKIEIQGKGTNQYTGDNRANFIICTNHKDAIQKTSKDRRYAIFYTAQQSADDCARDGMDGAYFKELYDWLKKEGGDAIIGGYLRGYALDENFDPAGLCQRAPETSSTNEAISVTCSPAEAEIREAIEAERYGFCGGFISSIALDRMLTEVGQAKWYPRKKRNELLEDMGYIKHPALTGGRSTQVIPFEEGRPLIYVYSGHPHAGLTEPRRVMAAYTTLNPPN